ncbi:MAG: HPP family protein [Comamonadaceae bacterium]|nr:HPP family protein [Comamonadaceae bacterium]
MSTSLTDRLHQLLLDLRPAPTGIALKECLRIMGGCALSVGIVATLAQWLAQSQLELFWHGATLASSALLVFALPFSPMAQPWAVLMGSLLCTAVGMACSWLLGHNTVLAASLAVPLAIVAMIYLRAVHPPATSLALYAVLQHIHTPSVLLFPIGFNLLLLIAIAMAYNHATGRRYPHRQISSAAPDEASAQSKQLLTQTDVDQALARHNELLAISRRDLTKMLQKASGAAYERTFGELRCADVMTTQVHSVQADMAIGEFEAYMRQCRHRELPVLDADGHLLGMVGMAQWMDLQNQAPAAKVAPSGSASQAAPQGSRWRQWVRMPWKVLAAPPEPPAAEPAPAAPQRVRDIMAPSVAVAHGEQPVLELLGLLCQGGLYHLPVVGENQRLLGIITQTDVLRALNQALPETAPRSDASASGNAPSEPEAQAPSHADEASAPSLPAPEQPPAQPDNAPQQPSAPGDASPLQPEAAAIAPAPAASSSGIASSTAETSASPAPPSNSEARSD